MPQFKADFLLLLCLLPIKKKDPLCITPYYNILVDFLQFSPSRFTTEMIIWYVRCRYSMLLMYAEYDGSKTLYFPSLEQKYQRKGVYYFIFGCFVKDKFYHFRYFRKRNMFHAYIRKRIVGCGMYKIIFTTFH